MSIKKKLIATLLGMILIVTTSCSSFGNRSRVEQAFWKLDQVYPTSSLEELIEKFPDKVVYIYHAESRISKVTGNFFDYNLSITKDKKGEISGKITIIDLDAPEYKKSYGEDKVSYEVEYDKSTKKFVYKDTKKEVEELSDIKFLFQMLDVKNNPIQKWENNSAKYREITSDYMLTYYIENEELAKYLDVDKRIKISLERNGNNTVSVGSWQVYGMKNGNLFLEDVSVYNEEDKERGTIN